jgi:4-diphosphocytidyl-2-C-methyl-D-erythritol kinase
MTVFQQIDLCDILVFQKIPSSFRIESRGVPVPQDRRNLVFRAFDVFRERAGIQGGLYVRIQKTIPVGAGLGGGSSNAATALIALNRLYRRGLSEEDLSAMAINVGSDVPFFIRGGTALGEGRGEILTPLAWKEGYWIVLICPNVQVGTAWAYSHMKLGLTKAEKITNLRAILGNCAPSTFKNRLTNEFETVVFDKHPVLKEIKQNLIHLDAFYASMSGSGSSVYGLFHDREHAEQALLFFSKKQGMSAFLSKPVFYKSTGKT